MSFHVQEVYNTEWCGCSGAANCHIRLVPLSPTNKVRYTQLDGIHMLLYIYYHSIIYSIPANMAIYQVTPAVVFILSVPLLRERVTLLKVLYNYIVHVGLDVRYSVL